MTDLNLFKLRSDILASVSQLFQRSEKSANEDVKALQEWMKTQSHIPEILDEKILQNFLILNKFSIERSKGSIDMYYTLRSRIPEMYERANPNCSNMKEAMEMVYYVLGPKMTNQNYRLFFFKLRKTPAHKLDPVDVARLTWNCQEIRLKEDVMFGDIIIYDMEGLTLSYLTKLTPSFFAKVHTIYSKIYSIPIKGIYVLNNSSPYLSTLLSIVKTFLKPKIFQRIHVCEDTSILLEHFQKEIIPKDYGGDEKSLEELNDMLKLKFSEHGKRFDQLDTLRVNEDLRPKTLENNELLGFYGNFKKLNFD